MLTATVTVSLDHLEPGYYQDVDRDDRYALQHLPWLPDGAHVVVLVGERQLLSPSAVQWLHDHVDRLHIEISAASLEAARRWYDAIKRGRCV